MAELDYQMALVLQHRFEQECKSSKSEVDTDFQLAKQLQEQFEHEEAVDKPTNNLVYKPPKPGLNSSKSLTDPSWELVDPTPDIHSLFIVFNERFFWNKLLAVCVSWSKRMTSCAGICSYQGRGGMCSITLSEPLLKLRPRKDLVETLLHEMIHAYLFVTHNNKDRDGHGPEFHKHMYRINKESGTNITVYHDFHDEVRLYKQHWWRCNGPCQRWKPYFGMVRRATNRAPGPNDRWWGEHSRNCGGTFIKVKEPEKNEKKRKKTEVKSVTSVKSKDIRDFLPVKSSNVKTLNDLNAVTTTKDIVDVKVDKEVYVKPPSEYSDEFLSVRNHWANKFGGSNKRPAVEAPNVVAKIRRTSEEGPSNELCDCPVCNTKVKMADLNDHLDVCLNTPKEELKKCPLCSEEIKSSIFATHLDQCSTVKPGSSKSPEMKECPLCYNKFESSNFDTHVEKCVMKVYDGIEEKLETKESETVSCLACGKKIRKSDLNSHLDDCMIDIFDDGDKQTKTEGESSKSEFNCPFCMKLVEESGMKEHIDVCLKADNADFIEEFLNDTF